MRKLASGTIRIFQIWIRRIFSHPIFFGLAALAAIVLLNRLDLLQQLNRLGYDMMLWQRGSRPTPAQVVVVDIDETSLRQLGRWPWPRFIMGELISKLGGLGARVVALDMTFSEADQAAGVENLKRLQQDLQTLQRDTLALPPASWQQLQNKLAQHTQQADADAYLAQAIQRSGTQVILGFFMHFPQTGLGHTLQGEEASNFVARLQTLQPSALGMAQLGDAGGAVWPHAPVHDLVTPLPQLMQAAGHSAYFNDWPDKDNTSRSQRPVYLIAGSDGAPRYYPSLGFAAAALQLQAQPQLIRDADGMRLLLVDRQGNVQRRLPLGADGRLYLNYYGPLRSFRYISAVDVLQGKVTGDSLKGATVFVGSSAPGVFDLVKIPLEIMRGFRTPGVEVHATLAANILQNDYLAPHYGIYLLLLLLVPLVMIFVLARSGPLMGMIYTLAVGGGELALSYGLLVNRGWVVWTAVPLLSLVFIYIGVTLVKYRSEEAKRRFIKLAFEHYLSPTVIEQIVANPEQLQLKGERRHLTIMFSDIRDFTGISERLTPAALHELLNTYLTPMTDVILENQGTLDKYIGDAIMAFFGAPLHHPQHARHACAAALGMHEALRRLHALPGFPPLQMGVGLNSGEVSVGNMGSNRLFDYTVLGDPVNLASRLEGVNKLYGTTILLSASTYSEVHEEFLCREIDRIQVKGKRDAVTIYELLQTQGRAQADDRSLVKHYQSGLQEYRRQNWGEALSCFETCLRLNPQDQPARLFVERSQQLLKQPPLGDEAAAWDGIYRFQEK